MQYGIGTPSRSESTERRYRERYAQIERQYRRESGSSHTLEPSEVAAHLLARRPSFTSMSTYRQYKAAVLYVLESSKLAGQPNLTDAINALKASASTGLPKRSSKTSGTKLKIMKPHALQAIEAATTRFLIKSAGTSQATQAARIHFFVRATMITGLRPSEWLDAKIIHDEQDGDLLRVVNSKASNGRANGTHRTMLLSALTPEEISWISGAIQHLNIANRHALSAIELEQTEQKMTLQIWRDLKALIKFTLDDAAATGNKQLKPSDFKGCAPYTFRHIFFASAKQTLRDPVLIAALGGHSSDETAFEHYAPMRSGSVNIRVMPTEESIAAVRNRAGSMRLRTKKQLADRQRTNTQTHTIASEPLPPTSRTP